MLYLFNWLLTSLSTLYRSYHDSSFMGRRNQYTQLVNVFHMSETWPKKWLHCGKGPKIIFWLQRNPVYTQM